MALHKMPARQPGRSAGPQGAMRKNPRRDGAWPSFHPRPLPAAVRTSEPTSPDTQTSFGTFVGKIQTDAVGRPFFAAYRTDLRYSRSRLRGRELVFDPPRGSPHAEADLYAAFPRHKTPKAGTPVASRMPRARTAVYVSGKRSWTVQGKGAHASSSRPGRSKPAHLAASPDMTPALCCPMVPRSAPQLQSG